MVSRRDRCTGSTEAMLMQNWRLRLAVLAMRPTTVRSAGVPAEGGDGRALVHAAGMHNAPGPTLDSSKLSPPYRYSDFIRSQV